MHPTTRDAPLHPQWVDETTLAQILRLSERTLQAWRIRGGGPPFYRFGRTVRYRLDEAIAWAEEQRRCSTWEESP